MPHANQATGWKDARRAVMDLIFTSTSPYRRQLLARLGVPFRAVAPTVDEGLPLLAVARLLRQHIWSIPEAG